MSEYFDGFSVYKFTPTKEGWSKRICMTITENSVLFSANVMRLLNYPNFVRFLFNEGKKQVVIQVCREDGDGAFKFYKTNRKQSNVRISRRCFTNKLHDIAPTDYTKYSIVCDGVFVPDEQAIIFDLNNDSKTKNKGQVYAE